MTTPSRHDVVVVGARCAGATLATFLARAGASVLLPGRDEGAIGPPMELQQVVFSHVAKTPSLRARMAATLEHKLSPLETFPVRQVLWRTLGAALRGSPGVIPEFLTMGRRGSANNRELSLRRQLLVEAEASEADATKVPRQLGEVST
jgi:glycine/D-amino acid oxidase-like deaminating enzyme